MVTKDWLGNKTSVFSNIGARTYATEEREKNDYYATDPKALEIFLNKLNQDNIKLHENIWECACGEGHLSKTLKNRGFEVYSTDLINRGYGNYNIDFLKLCEADSWNGDILTNPPYKYAHEFVEKSLEVIKPGYYSIMFLKIQFLEGKTRRKLFEKNPPKYVYVNSARQVCAKNGDFAKYKSSAMCYCWFVWEKGFTGEPVVRWI